MIEVPEDIVIALREAIPEECKPCYRPHLFIRDISQLVIKREISLMDAEYEVSEHFNTHCNRVLPEEVRCMKAGDCPYIEP